MTNPGAGANKIFVAPAPEKYLKRLQLQRKCLAPGSGFPVLISTMIHYIGVDFLLIQANSRGGGGGEGENFFF